MLHTFLEEQQRRKEQLEIEFPEQIVKNISLSILMKIAYILDLPTGQTKRELLNAIILTQDKYKEKLDTIFFYSIQDGIYTSIELNESCDFYKYMIEKDLRKK